MAENASHNVCSGWAVGKHARGRVGRKLAIARCPSGCGGDRYSPGVGLGPTKRARWVCVVWSESLSRPVPDVVHCVHSFTENRSHCTSASAPICLSIISRVPFHSVAWPRLACTCVNLVGTQKSATGEDSAGICRR